MIQTICKMAGRDPNNMPGYGSAERAQREVVNPQDVDTIYVNSSRLRDGGAGDERLGLEDQTVVMFIMKDKTMKLHAVSHNSDAYSHVQSTDVLKKSKAYREPAGNRREKLVQSAVAIANKHGVRIPDTSAMVAGVVTNKDGKLEVFKPQAEQVKGGKKVDLTKIPDEQFMPALTATLNHAGARTFHKVDDQAAAGSMAFNSGFNISDKLERAMTKYSQETFPNRDKYAHQQFGTGSKQEGQPLDLGEVTRRIFGKNRPDAVYMTTVEYGAENKKFEVVMLVKDGKVSKVDGKTSEEKWQSWNDYDRVAEQLNKFADDNNLRFTYQSFSNSALRELRVSAGRVTTETVKQSERTDRLEKRGQIGQEGTDELPLTGGAKWVRMDLAEQQQWSRRDNKFTIRGSAWKFVVPQSDGATYVPVILDVKNNDIVAVYHHGWRGRAKVAEEGWKLPTEKGSHSFAQRQSISPYVKAAAEQFGWGVGAKTAAFRDRELGRWLQGKFSYDGGSFKVRSTTYDQDNWRARDIKKYERAGYIRRERVGRSMQEFTLTPLGRQAWQQARENNSAVDVLSLAKAAPVQSGWSKPEPQQPEAQPEATPTREQPARPARAPRPVRGGTKAQQAIDWFNEFTTDNGRIPRRSEFIERMQQDPFNMSGAGAQTYYYNTKKKVAAQQNESAQPTTLDLITEAKISPFGAFFI